MIVEQRSVFIPMATNRKVAIAEQQFSAPGISSASILPPPPRSSFQSRNTFHSPPSYVTGPRFLPHSKRYPPGTRTFHSVSERGGIDLPRFRFYISKKQKNKKTKQKMIIIFFYWFPLSFSLSFSFSLSLSLPPPVFFLSFDFSFLVFSFVVAAVAVVVYFAIRFLEILKWSPKKSSKNPNNRVLKKSSGCYNRRCNRNIMQSKINKVSIIAPIEWLMNRKN